MSKSKTPNQPPVFKDTAHSRLQKKVMKAMSPKKNTDGTYSFVGMKEALEQVSKDPKSDKDERILALVKFNILNDSVLQIPKGFTNED